MPFFRYIENKPIMTLGLFYSLEVKERTKRKKYIIVYRIVIEKNAESYAIVIGRVR